MPLARQQHNVSGTRRVKRHFDSPLAVRLDLIAAIHLLQADHHIVDYPQRVLRPRVVARDDDAIRNARSTSHVDALRPIAIAAGTNLPRILLRHILPNTMAPLLVQATYVCASAMITEAILSFIGAGTPPNIPSWGNIMAEARSLFQIAGYLILFPGICLSLTVLAVNLLGDGMRDALDPRLARRM